MSAFPTLCFFSGISYLLACCCCWPFFNFSLALSRFFFFPCGVRVVQLGSSPFPICFYSRVSEVDSACRAYTHTYTHTMKKQQKRRKKKRNNWSPPIYFATSGAAWTQIFFFFFLCSPSCLYILSFLKHNGSTFFFVCLCLENTPRTLNPSFFCYGTSTKVVKRNNNNRGEGKHGRVAHKNSCSSVEVLLSFLFYSL